MGKSLLQCMIIDTADLDLIEPNTIVPLLMNKAYTSRCKLPCWTYENDWTIRVKLHVLSWTHAGDFSSLINLQVTASCKQQASSYGLPSVKVSQVSQAQYGVAQFCIIISHQMIILRSIYIRQCGVVSTVRLRSWIWPMAVCRICHQSSLFAGSQDGSSDSYVTCPMQWFEHNHPLLSQKPSHASQWRCAQFCR